MARPSTMTEARADALLGRVAEAILVLELLLLLLLHLAPMPDRLAVPGRAPRAVVGS